MKINGPGGIGPLKAYTAQIKKDKSAQKGQNNGQILGDSVEISKEAMEMQSYRSMLDKLPAVREELVASLKQSIQDGSYRPDSEKIAAGIISDRNLDKASS
ncbi:flagellar biosynthesis anti-sigma factor FlgM [Pelotomaculum propionicicum]|uniref:flagellar biosynthesis anti-sigma factor FlgM n=1 Tax=Pelotomaculum propionicicum TaxID=258475 RepID=UPI003B76D1FD